MKYLIDTHILLWWFQNPSLLSNRAREIISNPNNVVMVSSVSTWEIVIKKSLGKLKAPDKIFDLIIKENFLELPVTINHTRHLQKLKKHHNDPFDHLLIAQAKTENLTLLTRDRKIQKYNLNIIEA